MSSGEGSSTIFVIPAAVVPLSGIRPRSRKLNLGQQKEEEEEDFLIRSRVFTKCRRMGAKSCPFHFSGPLCRLTLPGQHRARRTFDDKTRLSRSKPIAR